MPTTNISRAARTFALHGLAQKGFRASYLPTSGQFLISFKGRQFVRSYEQVCAFVRA